MSAKRVPELTDLSVVGIDIGKDVFHLVGFDDFGDRVLRVKIKRLALTQVFDQMPRCIVGMEAGSGSSRGSSRRSTSNLSARAKRTTTMTPKRLPRRLCVRT